MNGYVLVHSNNEKPEEIENNFSKIIENLLISEKKTLIFKDLANLVAIKISENNTNIIQLNEFFWIGNSTK
jgi:hypothetical protein